MIDVWSREQRSELLGNAPAEQIVEVAESLLADEDIATAMTIVHRPEVGSVVLQIREPVADERFLLADVVVTRAEVALDGRLGWVMRAGTDRAAAFAGALCDAVAETDRPEWADLRECIADLCRSVEAAVERAIDDEWAEIAPTVVEFEALD